AGAGARAPGDPVGSSTPNRVVTAAHALSFRPAGVECRPVRSLWGRSRLARSLQRLSRSRPNDGGELAHAALEAVKPRLRGVLHQGAWSVSLVVGVLLIVGA